MLASAGAVAAPLWFGHALALGVQEGFGAISVQRHLSAGRAEGRISDVTSSGDETTVVWLVDGTRLTVPSYAQRGPEAVGEGDDAQARYSESEGAQVATGFRVVPHIEAP